MAFFNKFKPVTQQNGPLQGGGDQLSPFNNRMPALGGQGGFPQSRRSPLLTPRSFGQALPQPPNRRQPSVQSPNRGRPQFGNFGERFRPLLGGSLAGGPVGGLPSVQSPAPLPMIGGQETFSRPFEPQMGPLGSDWSRGQTGPSDDVSSSALPVPALDRTRAAPGRGFIGSQEQDKIWVREVLDYWYENPLWDVEEWINDKRGIRGGWGRNLRERQRNFRRNFIKERVAKKHFEELTKRSKEAKRLEELQRWRELQDRYG